MKHDFFERIFLWSGFLIAIFIIIASLGNMGMAFLDTYVDMGIIKIPVIFLYITMAFIACCGVAWFIGKGVDKFILHTWGEETYEGILVIAFIVIAIIFVIIGALIGWYMFKGIILKIIAAIIGAIIGFVSADKLLID